MGSTGTGNLDREYSGGSEEEFLILDTEEWNRVALDWERRGQVSSRRTDRAFFQMLLWFILIGGGISVISSLYPALFSLEPIWKSPMPTHADDVVFALFIAFLGALAISKVRKYGKRASRVRIHGDSFDIATKRGKAVVHVPVGRLKKIEVREEALGAGNCGITLVDADGRKYTVEHPSDESCLGALAEFCRRSHVRYERRRESMTRAILLYCIGAAFFALWLAATNSDEWRTPVMVLALLLLSRNFRIGES